MDYYWEDYLYGGIRSRILRRCDNHFVIALVRHNGIATFFIDHFLGLDYSVPGVEFHFDSLEDGEKQIAKAIS